MIHVTLSELMVVYLLLLLGGVGAMWVVRKIGSVRSAWRLRKTWVICQACDNQYQDTSPAALPVCPVCHRANERLPIREI
jgi:uncharacterized paraquat-inducible protein A